MLGHSVFILFVVIWNLFPLINTQQLPLCKSLKNIEGNEENKHISEVKSRGIRALCDAIHSTETELKHNNDLNSIPDFDLTQIASGKNILGILLIAIKPF